MVHDIVSYSTSSYIEITPLSIIITPKLINSKIILKWMINFESHHDTVFVIYRKIGSGTLTKIGYNNTIEDNVWNGVAPIRYDNNNSSTIQNTYLTWTDTPNTIEEITYYVYIKTSSTDLSYPFYLNRTYDRDDK